MLIHDMEPPFIAKLQSAGPLPSADKTLLLDLFKNTVSLRPRRDLVREGEKPDRVHLMIEGWACRYKLLSDGSRQITAFLIPGDFCDTHITIFDEMDHSISSLTDCKVAEVSREAMAELTDRPAIARALWWASLVDEATLRAWIVNMGRREALVRIAHVICELHARLRNVGLGSEEAFELPLTQEELADALGLTAVHINRTLKELRVQQVMSFKRQNIIIEDMAALRRMADFDPNYLHLPRVHR